MTTALHSQNGWVASANRAEIDVHNYLIDGANQHFAMCSKAAPVLGAFLAEFNKLIELINKSGTVFDDWGYHFALILNSKDYSNHCSGSAVDVNSTKHVWKSPVSGYTSMQESFIDELCKKYGIRWGWRYKFGFKDPMHFEIVETPAQVAARIIKMKLPMPKVMK